MNIPEIWKQTKGAGVTVALLDTGVSMSQALPKLRISCHNAAGKLSTLTSSEHGTFCAGLIVGSGKQIWGSAPEARVLSFNVASAKGRVSPTRVQQAVQVAMGRGVDLISCSFTITSSQADIANSFASAVARGIPIFGACAPDGTSPLFPEQVADVIVVGPLGDATEVPAGIALTPRVDLLVPGKNLETVRANGKGFVWPEIGSSPATAVAAGVGALLLALTSGEQRRNLGRALRDLLRSTGSTSSNFSTARVLHPVAALAAVEKFLHQFPT